MSLLEGKTAIVTGASRGIGKAIALKFAQEGCNVAFTDLFEDENMKATEAELKELGVEAKGYASDASNFADTDRVVTEIVKDFGRIDALVNNAGITKDTLLMRMTEDQWDAVINVNLKSVFKPFLHFGMNPLFVFVLAGMFGRTLKLITVTNGLGKETTLLNYYYTDILTPLFGNLNGSLAFAVSHVVFFWMVAYFLYRNKIFIKI